MDLKTLLKDVTDRLESLEDCCGEAMDEVDLNRLKSTISNVESLKQLISAEDNLNIKIPFHSRNYTSAKNLYDHITTTVNGIGEDLEQFDNVDIAISYNGKSFKFDNCAVSSNGLLYFAEHVMSEE